MPKELHFGQIRPLSHLLRWPSSAGGPAQEVVWRLQFQDLWGSEFFSRLRSLSILGLLVLAVEGCGEVVLGRLTFPKSTSTEWNTAMTHDGAVG